MPPPLPRHFPFFSSSSCASFSTSTSLASSSSSSSSSSASSFTRSYPERIQKHFKTPGIPVQIQLKQNTQPQPPNPNTPSLASSTPTDAPTWGLPGAPVVPSIPFTPPPPPPRPNTSSQPRYRSFDPSSYGSNPQQNPRQQNASLQRNNNNNNNNNKRPPHQSSPQWNLDQRPSHLNRNLIFGSRQRYIKEIKQENPYSPSTSPTNTVPSISRTTKDTLPSSAPTNGNLSSWSVPDLAPNRNTPSLNAFNTKSKPVVVPLPPKPEGKAVVHVPLQPSVKHSPKPERKFTTPTVDTTKVKSPKRDGGQADFDFMKRKEKKEPREEKFGHGRQSLDFSRRKQVLPKITRVCIPDAISGSNLATLIRKPLAVLERKAQTMGMTNFTHNYILNQEEASSLVLEFHIEPIATTELSAEVDLTPRPPPDDPSLLPIRPPIVTIMGHVDHGKTTLLDALRNSSVVAGEAGGITQHIGAFSVTLPSKQQITFLDTPGHAAFSAMRKRGAVVTDIVVLVVAADDGVMPQTIEAIKHALAAEVPIIVAINKCDKGIADLTRVENELLVHGIQIEDLGGDTPAVKVSALKGTGLAELEETILAVAEIQDIRAETDGPVEGFVIESQQKKGLGSVATVLVKRGTLKTGDVIVAGTAWAKVRIMQNDLGKPVKTAPPGTPVIVSGWKELPDAGDMVLGADSESKARQVVAARDRFYNKTSNSEDIAAINAKRAESKEEQMACQAITAKYRKDVAQYYQGLLKEHPVLPDGYILHNRRAVLSWDAQLEKGKEKNVTEKENLVLNLVVKADVMGSMEAVLESLKSFPQNEITIKVITSGVGPVTEKDLTLAESSGAKILCFNVTAEKDVLVKAKRLNLSIYRHDIIYRLLEEVQRLMEDLLPATVITTVTGEADILQRFDLDLKKKTTNEAAGAVAGCKVFNGTISANQLVRVMREKQNIWEGSLATLRHHKDKVTEVKKGTECGMMFGGFGDFKVGDVVQGIKRIEERRNLYAGSSGGDGADQKV